MEVNVEDIGLIAAALTTGAFIPQVYHVWKSKSSEGLSSAMLFIYLTGNLLWFVYGLGIHSNALLISSSVTLFLQLCLIYFKWKYGPGRQSGSGFFRPSRALRRS